MRWINLKHQRPPCDETERLPFVIVYHTVLSVGAAHFWLVDEDLKEELEEEFKDKYLCSFHFIFSTLDGDGGIQDRDEDGNFYADHIFERSPHYSNEGTISHWMPLPFSPPDANPYQGPKKSIKERIEEKINASQNRRLERTEGD